MITKLFFLIFCFCAAPLHAKRYALLIGNNTGGNNLETLKYVEKDLEAVQTILIEHCNFSKLDIRVMSNQKPSELESCLDSIQSILLKDTTNLFLFYYTGHADSKSLKMGNEEYPLLKFKEKFTSINAAIRIGIFDACQSGSFTRLKGGQLAEPFLLKDIERTKGQVILSSSSATENSQESDLYGHSIFTFHLVNALRGSGDISGDGKVTLGEAYQYTYNHTISSTARSWGGVQHPSYQFHLQGESDIVLADLNEKSIGVVLDSDISGPVTISDYNNNIVADFVKEAGKKVIIAVQPGKYLVNNNREKQSFSTIANVQKDLTIVKKSDLKYSRLYNSNSKGRELKNLKVSLQINGNFSLFNFSQIENEISEEFRGYRLFKINPTFKMSSVRQSPGADIMLSFGTRSEVRIGFKATWLNDNQEHDGSYFNLIDSSDNPCRLNISHKLTIHMYETAYGYHANGFLKGFFTEAGVQICQIRFTLNSTFNDSLFNSSTNNQFIDQGICIVPFVESGYLHQILPVINVGASVRYRIQPKPIELTSFKNESGKHPLRYSLKGFALAFFCKIDIGHILGNL